MKLPTDSIRQVKITLVLAAVVIAVVSLAVSHMLIRDLQREEIAKMEVWTEAMRSLIVADETTDLNLVLKVINSNNNIPIVVTDGDGEVSTHRNLTITAGSQEDSLLQLNELCKIMKKEGDHMILPLDATDDEGVATIDTLHVYYKDSLMLKRLSYFPFVQLGIVGLFVVVAVFALLSSKRAEQNKVWVGLSKETAHQLGTPISSLMAWTEVLKEMYPDDDMIGEMENDVLRLQLIAERFSKIGSIPELKNEDLCIVVRQVVIYISRRTSDKVHMSCNFHDNAHIFLPLSAPLVEWVIEVLCKNAIDAMSGEGSINIDVFKEQQHWVVEVADTGKGIPRKNYAEVFKPGFTTKQRGWGLGLSLAKRIVEEYHHGKIYVKNSEMGRGTTFRIELNA